MKQKIKAINKKYLQQLIEQEIIKHGNECDLNHIDISQITDMSNLFYGSSFNDNISQWDTSNVTNMSHMFSSSEFNSDISSWNVSKVRHIQFIFCNSRFNQDISTCGVSNVTEMNGTFKNSEFSYVLNNWIPKKLGSNTDIFKNSPAPLPYWAQVEPEFIQQVIEVYQLQQKLQAVSSLNALTPNLISKI